MTNKSVAHTYKIWLQARQEKVIFHPKYGHERVAQSVNRKEWTVMDTRDMADLIGKDTMFQEMGLKDFTQEFQQQFGI